MKKTREQVIAETIEAIRLDQPRADARAKREEEEYFRKNFRLLVITKKKPCLSKKG